MQVRAHFPDSEQGIQLLAEQVSILHAEAVISYLDKLELTKNEKSELVKEIIKSTKKIL